MADLAAHLATTHHVPTPTHPGWATTARPEWFAGISVLVETYLDLLDDRDLRDVTVLGNSFGGWIATELALRDRGRRIGRLVLLDAIGPLIAGHELRVPGAPPPADPPRGGPSPANIAALRAYGGPAPGDPALLHRLGRVAWA